MELKNLTQYDKRNFKKFFGLYIKEVREALGWSTGQLGEFLKFSASEVCQLESGQKTLTQDSFDYLRLALNLNSKQLQDIARITQAEMLMGFHREVNEQYPK